MQTSARPGLWAVLPVPFRAALVVALTTSLIAGTSLLRTELDTRTRSEISGAGPSAAPALGSEGATSPVPATATPGTVDARSEAVLSAPGEEPRDDSAAPGEGRPTSGRYVYEVEGYEEATAFGRRELPSEMTMSIDDAPPDDGSVASLEGNELVFDLFFSEDHTEREVVAYRDDGVAFTYESSSVMFGPGVTQSSDATYDPAMLQVPARLAKGATFEGTSTATASDGSQRRIEDWTVTVDGREMIDVFGREVNAWIVSIDRKTRPGSAEQLTRSRKYWFDPARGIWAKWEEHTTGSGDFGPGSFTYTIDFTATLDRAEPL
jgi:hypothetical protein